MLAIIVRAHRGAIFLRGLQHSVAMLTCTPGLKDVPVLATVVQDVFADHTADAKLAVSIGTPSGPSCRL